jgi:hypothetical protein
VKIQHAGPLVHEKVIEFWLGCTRTGTSNGIRIHFEIFSLHKCLSGSNMLVPLLICE